jgi:ubiquinone/menaquinone biosynthesis C-methylase UbiE
MPGASSASRREAATFDRIVGEEGDFNPFTDHGWDTLRRRFEQVESRPGLSLLDVGCGTARSSRIYAGRTSRYAGLDLSLAALVTARRRDRADVLATDAHHLPLAARCFDVVAFSSVLHHLPEPVAALREARRVLRPGGLIFAFDPNLLHPAMALFRHPKSPFYRAEGVSPDERPLAPRHLRTLFREAGLIAIGQRCQSDIPYRAVAPRGLDRLLPVYNRLDSLWELVGLGRWFGTFAVTWGRAPLESGA